MATADATRPVGLLGGTFDPVHRGHTGAALAVARQLGLAEVRLLPLGQAVHRQQPVATAEQRLAMCRLATRDLPLLQVDDRELRRGGGSYTVDTLADVRREVGEDTPLFFLMGQDSFDGFSRWRDPEGILALAHIAVMHRPGYPPKAGEWKDREALPNDAASGQIGSAGRVVFCNIPEHPWSSTEVRRCLSQAGDGETGDALEPNVRKYIRQHSIYCY